MLAAEPDGPRRARRRIRLRVRDHGRRRPAPIDPGHRGRGVPLMRAPMTHVAIDHREHHGEAGTGVVLLSNTVPDPFATA